MRIFVVDQVALVQVAVRALVPLPVSTIALNLCTDLSRTFRCVSNWQKL